MLRMPRNCYTAFIRSPDNISIELLQKGEPLPTKEPWLSAPKLLDIGIFCACIGNPPDDHEKECLAASE